MSRIPELIIEMSHKLAQEESQKNLQLPSLIERISQPPRDTIKGIGEGTSLGSYDMARKVQQNPMGNFLFGGLARNIISGSKGETQGGFRFMVTPSFPYVSYGDGSAFDAALDIPVGGTAAKLGIIAATLGKDAVQGLGKKALTGLEELVVAFRKPNGGIVKGKKGDMHFSIIGRESEDATMGFFDNATQKFMDRDEALAFAKSRDSTVSGIQDQTRFGHGLDSKDLNVANDRTELGIPNEIANLSDDDLIKQLKAGETEAATGEPFLKQVPKTLDQQVKTATANQNKDNVFNMDALLEDKSLQGMQVPDIGRELEARSIAKLGGEPRTELTPDNMERIANQWVDEATVAMEKSGHAASWYKDNLEAGVRVLSLKHPELLTDPNAKSSLNAAIAIASNGATVEFNGDVAISAYQYFANHGRFPEVGIGIPAKAMNGHFKLYNKLLDKFGADDLTKFLNTEFSVSELAAMGISPSGWNADAIVPGSAVFGGKVGAAFMANLNGNYKMVTTDRHFMRTGGRWTGDIMPSGKKIDNNRARVLKGLRKNSKSLKEHGFTYEQISTDDAALLEYSKKVYGKWGKEGFKNGTEHQKATREYKKVLSEPTGTPTNVQRSFMQETGQKAAGIMTQRIGKQVDPAWYPEQALYGQAKNSIDYQVAFSNLMRKEGFTDEQIRTAAGGIDATGRGAAGTRQLPSGNGSGGISGKNTQSVFSEDERSELIKILMGDKFVKPPVSQVGRINTLSILKDQNKAFKGKPKKPNQKSIFSESFNDKVVKSRK